MSKYINAEDLKSKITKLSEDDYYTPLNEYVDGLRQRTDAILEIVDEMPSADVAEVKHGEWINKRTMVHDGEFYCSACDFVLDTFMQAVFYNYCPNCGADMRERKETDD